MQTDFSTDLDELDLKITLTKSTTFKRPRKESIFNIQITPFCENVPKSNDNYIVNKNPFIPSDATAEELRIHAFLSNSKIFQVNIKEALEE